jgi:hypothetical protein
VNFMGADAKFLAKERNAGQRCCIWKKGAAGAGAGARGVEAPRAGSGTRRTKLRMRCMGWRNTKRPSRLDREYNPC